MRTVADSISACRLAMAETHIQMSTDGSSVRQTALQNAVLRTLEDGEHTNVVLSSAAVLEGKSAKFTVESIIKMMKKGGELLDGWAEVMERDFPNSNHSIPLGSEVNVSKMKNGHLTTDACDTARKTRRLLVEEIHAAAEELGMGAGENG